MKISLESEFPQIFGKEVEPLKRWRGLMRSKSSLTVTFLALQEFKEYVSSMVLVVVGGDNISGSLLRSVLSNNHLLKKKGANLISEIVHGFLEDNPQALFDESAVFNNREWLAHRKLIPEALVGKKLPLDVFNADIHILEHKKLELVKIIVSEREHEPVSALLPLEKRIVPACSRYWS